MTSSDEDEVYDVERILAERDEDGVMKYLVKWQNYPDDQCTWEPAESFDTPETLATWNKQKDLGDVLEHDDLQRIQLQMDAFQANPSSTGEPDDNDHTSEGDSDLDFDKLQPPKKRLRMVHDPPPLSDRARSLKRPEKERRKSISNAKPSYTRQPVTGRARPSENMISKTQKPQIARPASASLRDTEALNTVTPGLKSVMNTPPTTFHAPDLNSRKPRRKSASTSKPKLQVTSIAFKNLRHQNNAMKKQADTYYVGSTPAAPTASPTVNDGNQSTEVSRPPQSEPNDSLLFFSDQEMEATQELKGRQNISKRAGIRTAHPSGGNPSDAANEQVEIKVEAREEASGVSSTIPPTSTQQPGDDPMSEDTPTGPTVEQQHIISPRQQATKQSASWHQEAREIGNGKLVNTSPITHTADSQAQKSSLVGDQITISTHKGLLGSTSRIRNSDSVPGVDTSIQLGMPHQDVLGEHSLGQTAPPCSVYDDDQNRDMPARPYVAPGDVVRVPTGRQWIKGDLVVELFLTNSLAGGVKIENLEWEQRAPIIRLKPKHEHHLPLYFNDTIRCDEYRSITAASTWWSTFGRGAIEAFPDSKVTVASAANYLESNDLAAYWMHPNENLMLLLYSCRSPSWQYFNQPQPTRSGEKCLQIVCRNKLQIPQSSTTSNQPTSSIAQDSRSMDSRSPNQRHRRASLVSNSSVNLYDDVMKSPSDQLAREMADYNLTARGRRESESFVHAAPRETLQTITSKDPRSSRARSHSNFAANDADSTEDAPLKPPKPPATPPELFQQGASGQLDRDVK